MRIFNTLTRTIEELRPVTRGRVLVYGCGLTANRWANVGNLRTYVVQDLMVRVLMTLGHEVVWVMKVSDIAHTEQVDRSAPVEDPRYEVALLDDLDSLGVRRPDVLCRPVEHIAEMIRLVADLERIGVTYAVDGNVYFSVDRLPEYGRLAGQLGVDAARSVARVERDQRKRDPRDFVLWFSHSKYPNQTLRWESPWGVGYPGWHVQCVALARHYLGDRIDLHLGNTHHVHPHHSNELAIATARLGARWVSCWVHSGYLVREATAGGSRATLGLPRLAVLRERGVLPAHFRYFCVQAHYRGNQQFSWELLARARQAVERLRLLVQGWTDAAGDAPGDRRLSTEGAGLREQFWESVTDDLNMPSALTALWAMARSGSLHPAEQLALLADFNRVLGLPLVTGRVQPSADQRALLEQRALARARKQWDLADELRSQLRQQGLQVHDRPGGTGWYLTAAPPAPEP